MKVTTVRHTDVRGKELLYLRIENKYNQVVLVNVGAKTLNAVDALGMGELTIPRQIEENKIEEMNEYVKKVKMGDKLAAIEKQRSKN
ncbi:hypothetical protein [Antarctic microvirus TYR_006_V_SP_13]|nr:hypothetical protein [Antarctic microvirus TYR_006_V_SP_13]